MPKTVDRDLLRKILEERKKGGYHNPYDLLVDAANAERLITHPLMPDRVVAMNQAVIMSSSPGRCVEEVEITWELVAQSDKIDRIMMTDTGARAHESSAALEYMLLTSEEE